MSPFELVTATILGLVGGVALGGAIGGLVANATCAAEGPSWGDLQFHPAILGGSLAAGAAVVTVLHLLGQAPSRKRTMRARRRHG